MGEYAQNSLCKSSTGLTPFQCVLGFQPPLFAWSGEPSELPAINDWLQRSEETWNTAHVHLQLAIRRVREQADHHRRSGPAYTPGQWSGCLQKNLRLRLPCKKLNPRYVGPFKIIRQITSSSYHLAIPSNYRISPTFHVSLLKPAGCPRGERDQEEAVNESPPPIILDGEEAYKVQEIHISCILTLNSRKVLFCHGWHLWAFIHCLSDLSCIILDCLTYCDSLPPALTLALLLFTLLELSLWFLSPLIDFCLFDSAQLLVQALVISRLDYCNALLAGLPSNTIKPLQMIQNAAARLVFNEPKRAHVTPLFVSLHWLPVAARIQFKTLILAYKTTTGTAPTYFHSLLRIYIPPRSLRSASERHLVVPSQRGSKSLSRTFSFTIPGWWNDLPTPIRNAGSLSIFKQQLKTHIFQHYLTSSS